MTRARKNPNAPYWVMLRKAEKEIIENALRVTNHTISHAAGILGISYHLLYRRIEELGIHIEKRSSKKKASPSPKPTPPETTESEADSGNDDDNGDDDDNESIIYFPNETSTTEAGN